MTTYSYRLAGSSQADTSIAIQEYLQGKSMNQIADETGISKGKVHYLITNWKQRTTLQDINEIREFIVLVRKSNMSIQQCVQEFRLANILKNLGIEDDNDNSVYAQDDNKKNNNNSQYNEFSAFIQDIYLQCKNLGITSHNIISWIKDLLDFHSSFNPNSNSSSDKNISNTLFENDNTSLDKKSSADLMGPDISQIENESIHESNYKEKYNFNTNSKESLKEIVIPFISQISYHISKKKKENKELENYENTLKENIKNLQIQKNAEAESLNQIIKEEKFVISYLDFFSKLKKELVEKYNIRLEEDIQGFSQLINDFKDHGYEAAEIIQEYLKSISLKAQININEEVIRSLQKQKKELTKSVEDLQAQVDQHRQTTNIYHELQARKFGLKELKQLWNTIIEITEANDIPYEKAVSTFIKDIEKNYDDKLGLEKKIKEMNDEVTLLSNKVINCRSIIQSQPSI